MCSILCGFIAEEACYGSVMMSSPWHRGKDVRRQWSDPEVSYNLFYPLQVYDFTRLYLMVDRIEWAYLIKPAEKLTQHGDFTRGFV